MDMQRVHWRMALLVASLLVVPSGLRAGEPGAEGSGESGEVSLGRQDLETLKEAVTAELGGTEVFEEWSGDGGERPVLVFPPIENNTSPSTRAYTSALHTQLETYLVNEVPVDFVDLAVQKQLREERKRHPDYEADAGGESAVDFQLDIEVYTESVGESGDAKIKFVTVVEIVEADSGTAVHHSTHSVTKRVGD